MTMTAIQAQSALSSEKSHPLLSCFETASVQSDAVSLKAPFKSIHASASEAQWQLVYKLSAQAPIGFSAYCFRPLNKLLEEFINLLE